MESFTEKKDSKKPIQEKDDESTEEKEEKEGKEEEEEKEEKTGKEQKEKEIPLCWKKDVRLYIYLARNKNVRRAVILRRGPSRLWEMILWTWKPNGRDHSFQRGQWLKDSKIYPERCDLSPSGTHFLYFVLQGRNKLFSWSAVSRPPFFTAVSLWSAGDTWFGGGCFDGSDNRLLLDLGSQEHIPKISPPSHVKVTLDPPQRQGTPRSIEAYSPRFIFSSDHSTNEESVPVLSELSHNASVVARGASLVLLLPSNPQTDDEKLFETVLADFTHDVFEPVPCPDSYRYWS